LIFFETIVRKRKNEAKTPIKKKGDKTGAIMFLEKKSITQSTNQMVARAHLVRALKVDRFI
jgi:hypothetical protein